MLCLNCGTVLCGASEGHNHAKSHSNSSVGHELGKLPFSLFSGFISHKVIHSKSSCDFFYYVVYDLRSGEIYCLLCEDYVYHPLSDQLQLEERVEFDEVKLEALGSGGEFPISPHHSRVLSFSSFLILLYSSRT